MVDTLIVQVNNLSFEVDYISIACGCLAWKQGRQKKVYLQSKAALMKIRDGGHKRVFEDS